MIRGGQGVNGDDREKEREKGEGRVCNVDIVKDRFQKLSRTEPIDTYMYTLKKNANRNTKNSLF